MDAIVNKQPDRQHQERMLLELLQELLPNYVDLTDKIDRSTTLASIGVDSLTAAEVLFALEDKLDLKMGEPPAVPNTVGDVVDYALPYVMNRPGNGLQ